MVSGVRDSVFNIRRIANVDGMVLASGLSRRFGNANKLLALVDGVPVVRRTVEAYLGALERVCVVVGYDRQAVGAALVGLPVTLIENPDYAEGQSASMRCGLRSLSSSSDAVIIGVGDQ